MEDFVVEKARNIPVVGDVDVLVIGGGPAGISAAISAARFGSRVMLVERHGFLGGNATAGNVGIIFGLGASHRSSTPIVAGIPKEICQKMASVKGALPWEQGIQRFYFLPEAFKYVADCLVEEAGVEVLLQTFFTDCIVGQGRIEAVIVENKSGRQAIKARVFVDATGDADLAFRAGAEVTKGREFDGRMNAMGSIAHVGGIQLLSEQESAQARSMLAEAVRAKELRLRSIPHFTNYVPGMPGVMMIHIARFAGDATDAGTLTQAEIALRHDTWEFLQFCRREIPKMENAYLITTSPSVAVRETRQVLGPYIFTGDDVAAGRKFEDSIARGSWFIDIHCPMGYVCPESQICSADCKIADPCEFKTRGRHKRLSNLYPPRGDWYTIPYRCLVPGRPENLLVAGRCISATHEGMASLRVMGTCMAVGQAAGTAAGMCVKQGVLPAAVNANTLQERLKEAGALI